jgi:ATP-dependent Clp protease ATP-binding subunit ClpA
VVILTTNALTPKALHRRPVGFGGAWSQTDASELLAEHFPREFLARLDNAILFNPFGPDELRCILKLRLDEALARLRARNIRLVFEESPLLDALITGLEENKSGARGIARLLETRLLEPISMALLQIPEGRPAEFALGERLFRDGVVEFRRTQACL